MADLNVAQPHSANTAWRDEESLLFQRITGANLAVRGLFLRIGHSRILCALIGAVRYIRWAAVPLQQRIAVAGLNRECSIAISGQCATVFLISDKVQSESERWAKRHHSAASGMAGSGI